MQNLNKATLELALLWNDENGFSRLYKFDVPDEWLQKKLKDEFNTNYEMFQKRCNYFKDVDKIYSDADSLGIVENFREVDKI